ncbi:MULTISPECIES: metallophosphoesterase family protein [unclassified Bradyrhizobium]|uniref:metallophosphoesterase family protein n=1 Tax=unclassified Bradyrhizobium TaxID=2631580 RepID=UPI00247A1F2F|nr:MULTISPECIES: metallophosphoesterase family protein [unclassified Bradyrhizobium]WGS18638.1 metallophosphoesterase family protein [Bradyrhizobium sp. ISRA463]WGS25461.1 metallophosphoesterase family protein [Bradyrhizobium sp. ISRA464]
MKVQIFSDLHVGVLPIKMITIADGVEAVIVAGDVCEGAPRAFEHLRRIVPIHIPIVMVLGNHEFYRRFVRSELKLACSQAPAFNIHVLENSGVVLSGVRFVGATLWTDYRIFGDANLAGVMATCAAGMNDHRLIGWRKQPWQRFRPQEAALLHHQSRAYLTEVLAATFAGPTVVITHHAVHWDSILPKFRSQRLTAAYVSDLSGLISTHKPDIWVHGHVHNSSDYRIGATRIICNPHGYGSENPQFDPAMTVKIGE